MVPLPNINASYFANCDKLSGFLVFVIFNLLPLNKKPNLFKKPAENLIQLFLACKVE